MTLKISLITLTLPFTILCKPQRAGGYTTISDPGQLSRIASRMATYEASLTNDPKFSSIMSVGETAFPETLNWDDINAPGKTITTEEWYRTLPSDVKSWYSSVASEQYKFITDTSGPVPTAIPGAIPGSAMGSSAALSIANSIVSASVSAGSSAASAAASSASSSVASSAKASASQSKAGNGTASGAAEVGGDVRNAQAMAVVVAGAIGAVALLL